LNLLHVELKKSLDVGVVTRFEIVPFEELAEILSRETERKQR